MSKTIKMAKQELLPGVSVVKLEKFCDRRGLFLKTYSEDILAKLAINYEQVESFISLSKKDVIRGMHYQTPLDKNKYRKIVTCIKGEAIDVIVDIDKKSENFNKPISIKLSETDPVIISMPVTYAHGFIALREDTIMQYSTDLVYRKEEDKGVQWNSIDFEWPTQEPILSIRDRNHPKLNT